MEDLGCCDVTFMFESEQRLVDVLVERVPSLWDGVTGLFTEVGCHDQAHMDLLVVTHTSLIAVEAKLRDWKQVLAQAFLHKYCVHYRYVALPTCSVNPERVKDAARWGIGVLAAQPGRVVAVSSASLSQPVGRGHVNVLKAVGNRSGL